MLEASHEWSQDVAIAAYLDALTGVLQLARELNDEWHRPTDLDRWSVFDKVAHVSALEDELAGRSVPSPIHDWSSYPHVQTPFQQYTEVGVEARRSMSPADLVAELSALLEERTWQLSYVPDDPDAELRGPAGMVGPVSRVMGTRTLDVWAHEQDIRRATGRPTRMAGPAATASQRCMVEALPLIVARQAEAPAGTTVNWHITAEPDTEPGTPHPDATVTLPLEALQLLFCGQRKSQAVAVDVQGDVYLAERVISVLAVTP
ncbi:MAG: maleylpyruvate isomerase family mycothiol-dependent enzyme [Actinomycetia bacterium]|nr:maleylpyruvate isomerase family mycothiol-dependent enzyme [Actinomycetes bacterium]